MNLRNEFNRIGHLLHNGVGTTEKKAQTLAGKGTQQAAALVRRVRDQIDTEKLATTEEAIVRHVRQNPALYLMAAALIIGALVAKLLMGSRRDFEPPLS
jgi:hypothetical protein